MSTSYFRFLDLPAELCYVVYEQINATTKHYTLDSTDAPDQASTITLVSKELPVQILATCRLINTEVEKFLINKLQELKKQPIRFLVPAESAQALVRLDNSLTRCLGQRPQLRGSAPELSEAAEAFIERCTKTLVALRSCSIFSGCPLGIEFMLTDGDGPSRELLIYLFVDGYNLSIEHYAIILLRKEPATGIHDDSWQKMQNLAARSFRPKKRVHFADGPDAERWRKDWEETAGSNGNCERILKAVFTVAIESCTKKDVASTPKDVTVS